MKKGGIKNIFTNGDTINGRIILEASKETRIQSLAFIAKGKARVQFSEHYGLLGKVNPEISEDYSYKQKYYRMKQHILKETRQNGDREIIGKGRHVFPFSFRIPERLPSSFSSIFGQIIHTLKATLKQSMMPAKKAKTHFTFVSKKPSAPFAARQRLSWRCVRGHYHVGTLPYGPVSEGRRSGSALVCHHTFDANAGKKTVIKEIIIPPELSPSILNCSIIKLEYRLKVRVICRAIMLLATSGAHGLVPAAPEGFGIVAVGAHRCSFLGWGRQLSLCWPLFWAPLLKGSLARRVPSGTWGFGSPGICFSALGGGSLAPHNHYGAFLSWKNLRYASALSQTPTCTGIQVLTHSLLYRKPLLLSSAVTLYILY
uniref:Arrestin-like N-terminal domain-containing protein n=1 Tax=Fundulus heteroclitus TaxID=8078 RepID=A0A3Q2SZ18_FUNHE